MDAGSFATFCNDVLARQLNLQSRHTELGLKTMSLKHHVEDYLLTDLEVRGIYSNITDLPRAYTQKSIPASHLSSKHRKGGGYGKMPSSQWSNMHKALESWHVINSTDNEPYAIRTVLGWTVNGPSERSDKCWPRELWVLTCYSKLHSCWGCRAPFVTVQSGFSRRPVSWQCGKVTRGSTVHELLEKLYIPCWLCHWTTEEEASCHNAQQFGSTELSNWNSKQILSFIKSKLT